jgi:hypothetical protein
MSGQGNASENPRGPQSSAPAEATATSPANRSQRSCRGSLPGAALHENTDSTRTACETTITIASIVPAQRAKDADRTGLAQSFYVRRRNEMRNIAAASPSGKRRKALHLQPHIAQKMSTDVHRF